MAIINCPECKREVSGAAPSCPGCGAPIASAVATPPAARASAPEVQTIEQTGKKYKANQALGCVVALVSGIAFCTAAANDDAELGVWFSFGIVLGALWFIGARVFAWWKHG